MNILVLNGPNLNMLGIREPGIYGRGTYEDLQSLIRAHAQKRGVNISFYQSNHEGELVDAIQQAYYDGTDGIIFNPAAYTHTSVALLDALKAVGMYEYRAQAPHRLSGGQKQRVAIAGVIAMMPRCVVLDEPTAMLDPQGRREVMSVVRELNRKYGITVILITHHMDEAVQAQRVVVMHEGNVLMDGRPREIFTQVDKLRAASLTVPQTIEVLYDLNRQDGESLPIDALSVNECADILETYLA